jgi:hypothetical protein
MNTRDETSNCPSFIKNWFESSPDSFDQITSLKQNMPDFVKEKFDVSIASAEDRKRVFDSVINSNLKQESLLRSFIKQLLI